MADRLVDSDVLIDTLHGIPAAVSTLARLAREGRLGTTVINQFELECGAETEDERLIIKALLADFEMLVFDPMCAVEAASIDRALRKLGQRLETGDTIIAGIALSHRIPLITRNRKHFERVPGLVLVGVDPN